MGKTENFQFLKVSTEEQVATIVINRPDVLNAYNSETLRELQRAIENSEQDERVGVLVITGAGRAFCAGADLKEISGFRGADARRFIKLDFATKNRVAACSKPVIAALHGHVAGGGFELALACDIRIAAENVLFSLSEIALGTIPGSGGLQRLCRVVGLGIAKEWAFSGRRVGADEAYRTGLANRVVPLECLMAEAVLFARELTDKSPLALALAKVALDPEPLVADGLVGAYHVLVSQVCHDDPTYHKRTHNYIKKSI